MKFIASAGLV